jgi:hypothetical protein
VARHDRLGRAPRCGFQSKEPFAKFLRFEELCGFWLREAVILTPVLE